MRASTSGGARRGSRRGVSVGRSMLGGVLLWLLATASARAQTPDTLVTLPSCDGRRITAIDIQTHPPAVVGRSPNVFGRFVQRVLLQSATSREEAVRPFLIARVGRDCDDALLREASRALRALPYLASATVRPVEDTAQGVRLLVETVDEIPLVIGGGWDDGISAVTYGNSNVGGRGLRVVGRWKEGDYFRDGFALSARKHGLFGQPVVATLDIVRDPLGSQAAYAITRPYFTDRQRLAFHMGGWHNTTYNHFVRESGPTLSLRVDRDVWAMGAVGRVAWRGASLLLGPIATYEKAQPEGAGVAISDTGLIAPDTAVLSGRYAAYTGFRVGGTIGLRALSFKVAHGFDALIGEQDIARGFQVNAIVARAIDAFGADDRHDFLSADLYAGVGNERSFAGVRVEGEGQRNRDNEWRAVVMSGRAAWYVRPSERRTLEASTEFSGGWRERLPLQLPIGVARAGVRGFRDSPIAGGRRAVLRVEQRNPRGEILGFIHWGTAFFMDVGNTWSGDVPFGETKAARTSLGIGLLAAAPPTSRRTLRLDLAVPVTPGAPHGYGVRFSLRTAGRAFWREPGDIGRVRAGAAATSIFGWP